MRKRRWSREREVMLEKRRNCTRNREKERTFLTQKNKIKKNNDGGSHTFL